MHSTEEKIKAYMASLLEQGECLDLMTDEINHTELAWQACEHFNDWLDDDTVPDEYFDLAVDAGTAWEEYMSKGDQ